MVNTTREIEPLLLAASIRESTKTSNTKIALRTLYTMFIDEPIYTMDITDCLEDL